MMYWDSLHYQLYFEVKRKSLEAEADTYRQLQTIQREPESYSVSLRQRLGHQVIRFGFWVGGECRSAKERQFDPAPVSITARS